LVLHHVDFQPKLAVDRSSSIRLYLQFRPMSTDSYLMNLGSRLLTGLADMAEPRRGRHRNFVLSRQMPDGGFRGREGESDVYYTGFAVRSLMILDELDATAAERIAGFLKSQPLNELSVVDVVSWMYSALAVQLAGGGDVLAEADPNWADELVAQLEGHRRADGGYAKTHEGAAGSTYTSFLVALTYELLGRDIPKPNSLVQFIFDRQRDDGGFVEIAPMRRSGTNPTAAAIAILRMFDSVDDEIREDITHFLRDARSGEGGFQANSRVPFADGLSTFTGLLTAQDLGLDGILLSAHVREFLTSELEFPTGGFRGATWDDQADVEYTFYGLGILALLTADRTDDETNVPTENE
jgi:geranylgeranyl transferase type-2 subunit beta